MRRIRLLVGAGVAVLVVLAVALAIRNTEPLGASEQSQAGVAMKPKRVCLRIHLGLKDKQNTPWDGSISVQPGSVVGLEIWRKGQQDKIEGKVVDTPLMDQDDELLDAAVEIIRQTRRASTSSLQRRLRIGYTRAARLMDVLEEKGIIGPPSGSDPREILIDLDGEIPENQPVEPPGP